MCESSVLCNKSPQTSSVKQHTFILSHFWGPGVQAQRSWSSAQGPTSVMEATVGCGLTSGPDWGRSCF